VCTALSSSLLQETVSMPVYYPSPNVSRPACQLTEEEQVVIAQRMGLIQHLPTGLYDGSKKNRECVICMDQLSPSPRDTARAHSLVCVDVGNVQLPPDNLSELTRRGCHCVCVRSEPVNESKILSQARMQEFVASVAQQKAKRISSQSSVAASRLGFRSAASSSRRRVK
ncbi:hypothetical protein V5799_013003, partial [Amblyomma americanum]